MNHILKKYCPRIEFQSYEDFFTGFSIEVPENFNFAYDVVDEWARVEPDKLALVWCDDNDNERTFSFAHIAALSIRFAHCLVSLGVGKGDALLLMLRQRWEYWVAAVAAHRIGAIVVPATYQLNAKDIVYRVNAAGIKALVALRDSYVQEQVAAALPDCPSLQVLILAGAEGAKSAFNDDISEPLSRKDGTDLAFEPVTSESIAPQPAASKPPLGRDTARAEWLSFDALVNQASDRWELPGGQRPTHNDDIMLIYFTSGTSGPAKMCAHNFIHPLGHILTATYWQQVRENKLHCSVSDSGWAKFGWGKIYGQWLAGAPVFAYDSCRFEPLKLLERIERYRVSTFCVPPTIYRFLLQEDVGAFDLSHVETFTTAGEPLNAEVSIQWKKLTGKSIREGFGQSESPVLLATFKGVEPRPGSMGKPAPLMGIRLLNEQGQEVADGDEGTICVTGLRTHYPPGLFVGYYKDPQKTARAVGGDYYDLGDLAWRDESGYYTFVGRSDDVVKCSGYRISPFEVESVLIEHPAVLECAVTAAPDALRGSVVKATVVLARGHVASDTLRSQLQEHVKHSAAPFKYPRIVEFVDELPKTIGGKIKRAQIRTEDAGGSWEDIGTGVR
ncbi:MAG: AMP-binding protein [Coriobacteriales bacterium]|jgi:acetyl-CoA synthetase|nr:AMP-binding protein [Coriobacteriales bacterium]